MNKIGGGGFFISGLLFPGRFVKFHLKKVQKMLYVSKIEPLICIHLPTQSISFFPSQKIASLVSQAGNLVSGPLYFQFPAKSHSVLHQLLPVLPSNPILYLPVPLYLHHQSLPSSQQLCSPELLSPHNNQSFCFHFSTQLH